MQLQLQKRYTNGLSFLVSYNLSRMMSNTNSGFTSFASRSLNKDNQAAEWSIDNNDQTHIINIATTYELPFGKGRPFLNRGGIVNAIVGGWQISPLLTYATGTPLQVTVKGNPLGNGTANRPNVLPNVPLQFSYANVYQGLSVLNAAAFQDPGPWAIGNEKRYLSGIRNAFGYNENIAAAKYFSLGEHVRAKFEVEFFNVLNRVIFSGGNCSINTSLNDPNFEIHKLPSQHATARTSPLRDSVLEQQRPGACMGLSFTSSGLETVLFQLIYSQVLVALYVI
jgi:hypothetical protein